MSRNLIATHAETRSTPSYHSGAFRELRVILAIEDESLRRQLHRIVAAEDGINVIGQAGDIFSATHKILRLDPDLVFLDMEMPGLDGTDLITNVTGSSKLVLTSGLHQHAVRAFEANALDFLLKPFGGDRVRKTISRAKAALASEHRVTSTSDQIPGADPWIRPRVRRLAVHRGKRVFLLSLKDILYVKVDNRLVFAFTGREQYLLNRTISELEDMLRNEGFFQINRGTIINLDYLLEIIPWFSGTCKLRMTNDAEFQLSRDRVSGLKSRVGLPRRWSGK